MENKDSIIRESHGDIGDAHAGNIVLYCCLIYVDNLWSVWLIQAMACPCSVDRSLTTDITTS